MNLFKDASQYYKYRAKYPDSLIKLIKDKLSSDDKGNLLDIGCGVGFLAIPLSKYFEHVFAVDTDPGMIEEGKKKALDQNINNIVWINKNGQDLKTEDISGVRVVLFADSLHWFDQEKILKFVYDILPKDGVVILVGSTTIWRYAPELWQQKTLEVIKKYLGPERRTTEGVFQKPKYKFGESLRVVGFNNVEEIDFDFTTRVLNSDDIINLQFSMSYAAPELFGNKLNDFKNELKTELLKINPKDEFEEEDEGTVIFGWKN